MATALIARVRSFEWKTLDEVRKAIPYMVQVCQENGFDMKEDVMERWVEASIKEAQQKDFRASCAAQCVKMNRTGNRHSEYVQKNPLRDMIGRQAEKDSQMPPISVIKEALIKRLRTLH